MQFANLSVGLASTDLLDVVQRLEGILGRQLYPTLLFEHQTIDALARWLTAQHPDFTARAAGRPPAEAPAPAGAAPAAVETVYARPAWVEEPLAPTPPGPGPLVMLYPPPGADLPGPSGIVISAGATYARLGSAHFQVHPERPEDLRAVFEQLAREGVLLGGVVHVSTAQDPGALFGRLLALVRGVWTGLPEVRVPLLHLELTPGRPEALAARAFAATLARELPRLPMAVLEVDGWPAPATLSAEVAALAAGLLVRRKAGSREVQRWIEWRPEEAPPPLDLRDRCVIITGGVGGLGRHFARELAGAGAALLLTSRRPENADIRALLEELRALGGQAAYLSADVRDAADTDRLIAEARRRFGPVHGLIHAAGRIDDALLAEQDLARARAVLAPKIDGLRHLDRASAGEPLAFLLVCSSLAGVIGNVGQADYAFASGYMDGFAAFREEERARGRRQGRTTSIAWPLWQDGGMQVDAQTAGRMAQLGTRPLPTESGLRALRLAIGGARAGAWAVLAGDPAAVRTLLALRPPLAPTAADAPAARASTVDAGDAPIAVIGVAGRYPHAADLKQLWENLRKGHDAITEIPPDRWDHSRWYDPERTRKDRAYTRWGGFLDEVDRFDPLFFNIVPREAEIMDPQERLFLETAWHTLEDAGYSRKDLEGERVGVFVGAMYGHYQLLGVENTLLGRGPTPGTFFASIANRVSFFFDFRGPSLALDTMCSSSLTALHLACESLRRGESRYALVGGVNLMLHPTKYVFLSQARMASSDGRCRGFGADGDGYVPGEGVGAVLLKPLRQAEADGDRILAVIRGSAINHGGRTGGYSVPSPRAQAEVILEAIHRAGVDPRT
ncbi:MAG: SDR family NAD(P)-dependent oxidoreductase, partial [Byssovorax sp.]